MSRNGALWACCHSHGTLPSEDFSWLWAIKMRPVLAPSLLAVWLTRAHAGTPTSRKKKKSDMGWHPGNLSLSLSPKSVYVYSMARRPGRALLCAVGDVRLPDCQFQLSLLAHARQPTTHRLASSNRQRSSPTTLQADSPHAPLGAQLPALPFRNTRLQAPVPQWLRDLLETLLAGVSIFVRRG